MNMPRLIKSILNPIVNSHETQQALAGPSEDKHELRKLWRFPLFD